MFNKEYDIIVDKTVAHRLKAQEKIDEEDLKQQINCYKCYNCSGCCGCPWFSCCGTKQGVFLLVFHESICAFISSILGTSEIKDGFKDQYKDAKKRLTYWQLGFNITSAIFFYLFLFYLVLFLILG